MQRIVVLMIGCSIKRSKPRCACCLRAAGVHCGAPLCRGRLASLRAQFSSNSTSETESLHDAVVGAINSFVQLAMQAGKAKELPEAVLKRKYVLRARAYAAVCAVQPCVSFCADL